MRVDQVQKAKYDFEFKNRGSSAKYIVMHPSDYDDLLKDILPGLGEHKIRMAIPAESGKIFGMKIIQSRDLQINEWFVS